MTKRTPVARPIAPQRPQGFRPKLRTREIVCDAEAWPALAPEEGCPSLVATVRVNLSFEQIDSIPVVLKANPDGDGILITCDDRVRSAIAPYVVAWNCEAIDVTTGEAHPVPPPAEIGPDAFRVVDWQIGAWLAAQLKMIHRLVDRPKSAPPESTAETSGDSASAST